MILIRVTPDDYLFLYEMLKERKDSESISFKMPTYEQHINFVKNNDYTAWYVIWVGNRKVGNIYLTKNDEWGYFILEEFQGNGYGPEAFSLLKTLQPREYYYANINPENKRAIHLVEDKYGGKLIQYTYKVPGVSS